MATIVSVAPKNIYDVDGETLLVLSVVSGTVICVNAKSNGDEKNWRLIQEQYFKERAVLIGELMKPGMYKNSEGELISSGFGPVVLCEIIDPHSQIQTMLLYEAFNHFYGNPPVLEHVSDRHSA